MPGESPTLSGLTVVSFESRRAPEMAELIRRFGGTPMSAPALREVPLADNGDALAYVTDLEAGKLDVVIMMTGVGLRSLVKAVQPQWPADRLAAALRRATIIARGPKPVGALRELGLQPDATVPEPNTWRELLTTLDQSAPVAGKHVAVQEYGVTNQELIDGLIARGADVRRVRVYEWALPEDLAPLRNAIAAVLAGRVDVALFTSATQVYHLFQVAENQTPDSGEALRARFAKIVVGSIGPVCSEALHEHRLTVDFLPTHAKMGQLVGEAARVAATLLESKRRSTVS